MQTSNTSPTALTKKSWLPLFMKNKNPDGSRSGITEPNLGPRSGGGSPGTLAVFKLQIPSCLGLQPAHSLQGVDAHFCLEIKINPVIPQWDSPPSTAISDPVLQWSKSGTFLIMHGYERTTPVAEG